jgi:hypothetical protein
MITSRLHRINPKRGYHSRASEYETRTSLVPLMDPGSDLDIGTSVASELKEGKTNLGFDAPSALTSTVCVVPAGASVKFTSLRWLTSKVIPIELAFWNPLASALTSYVPTGRSGSE